MFRRRLKKKNRLTQSVACAGCASKLRPAFLRQALSGLNRTHDERLLVGFENADDAGIYQVSPSLALVQTVDFFTPIVDDPYRYGRIAAANALSDVYAMGGEPLTALNILCFPEDQGVEILKKILAGGLDKMAEAGCTLVGGHSVTDKELKYGLSVTGLIDPQRIFSNDRLKVGQTLVLTKKLGTGIISTAAKFDDCPDDVLEGAMAQMETLNKKAKEAMLKSRASTCTDITGFGLLGHLSEITRASHTSVKINAGKVPFLKGVIELIHSGYVTRGDKSNREYADCVEMIGLISSATQSLLFDPQTSGGLLIAMPREDVPLFEKNFGSEVWVIGETLARDERGAIFVEN